MNTQKPFTVGAILSSISYMKDGGMRIGFATQELTSEEKDTIGSHHQSFGHLLFQPNEVQDSDIPKGDVEDKQKTPSKRMRAALFVLYNQSGSKLDFEIYYREKMNKIIDSIKSRLD